MTAEYRRRAELLLRIEAGIAAIDVSAGTDARTAEACRVKDVALCVIQAEIQKLIDERAEQTAGQPNENARPVREHQTGDDTTLRRSNV